MIHVANVYMDYSPLWRLNYWGKIVSYYTKWEVWYQWGCVRIKKKRGNDNSLLCRFMWLTPNTLSPFSLSPVLLSFVLATHTHTLSLSMTSQVIEAFNYTRKWPSRIYKFYKIVLKRKCRLDDTHYTTNLLNTEILLFCTCTLNVSIAVEGLSWLLVIISFFIHIHLEQNWGISVQILYNSITDT